MLLLDRESDTEARIGFATNGADPADTKPGGPAVSRCPVGSMSIAEARSKELDKLRVMDATELPVLDDGVVSPACTGNVGKQKRQRLP